MATTARCWSISAWSTATTNCPDPYWDDYGLTGCGRRLAALWLVRLGSGAGDARRLGRTASRRFEFVFPLQSAPASREQDRACKFAGPGITCAPTARPPRCVARMARSGAGRMPAADAGTCATPDSVIRDAPQGQDRSKTSTTPPCSPVALPQFRHRGVHDSGRSVFEPFGRQWHDDDPGRAAHGAHLPRRRDRAGVTTSMSPSGASSKPPGAEEHAAGHRPR